MDVPGELLHLAESQDGLIIRQQALNAGMTSAAIEHALGRARQWQRLARGIYATFTGPLQMRHYIRAALLHAGPDAVVSGASTCRAYGLRYVPEDAGLVLLIPASTRRRTAPFATIRRVSQMPDVRMVAGIPTACPERAVLDSCLGTSSLREVRALLCEAVQRGLTTPVRIATALSDARWKGSKLVRRVIDDLVAGCRSAPECELRDLIRHSRLLTEPLWNQPLPTLTSGFDATSRSDPSPARGTMSGNGLASGFDPAGVPEPAWLAQEWDPVIRPDACWPDARVVVEIDSAEWHRYGDRVEQTERRRAAYARLGWTVVPVSPRRLREEPQAVLRDIEAAVTAGLARAA